jgi:FtsH-binding integral membrane protein
MTAERDGRPAMTTDTRRNYVLRGALLWSLAPLVLALVAGVLVDGGAGLVGALIGAVATIVVLGAGTWLVIKVASTSPAASLIVALCTFTAQGALLLVTLAIVKAAAGNPELSWTAAAVIAVTMVWTSAFAYFVRKERIPLFDLPGSGVSR